MTELPVDKVAETLESWKTAIQDKISATYPLLRTGYMPHPDTYSSNALGCLLIHDGHGHTYRIRFERKLLINRKLGARTFIAGVKIYHPRTENSLHISQFNEANVTKITMYAMEAIRGQALRKTREDISKQIAEDAHRTMGRMFKGFPFPEWACARPDLGADNGLRYQLRIEPLLALTCEQVKEIVSAISDILNPAHQDGHQTNVRAVLEIWRHISVPVPPELLSTPMEIKPILLCIPGQSSAVRGWFFGGLVNKFFMEGSPTPQNPTHWMPLPELNV